MVGAGQPPSLPAAPTDAKRRRHRLALAHVDEDAEGPVAERPHLTLPELGRDVAGHPAPLADRVLRGGWRGPLRPERRIGDSGAIADRPYVATALHAHRAVGSDAPPVEREAEALDHRRRPDARGPHDRPRRHGLAAAEQCAALVHALEGRLRADLDPAAPQLCRCELRQLRRDLRHHPVLRLDQQPAHPAGAAARIQLDRVGGEVLQLRQALQPRVARADEHVAQPLRALAPVLERLGDLEGLQDPVTERDRIGQRLEAEAVLGEAGHGQRARYRAERDDELVVAQALDVALRRADLEDVLLRPRADDLAEAQVRRVELLAQRHDDVARVERPGRGAGQQRGVQHEVDVVHERHPCTLRGQRPLQRSRGVEAAEAAACDHHMPGHGPRVPTRAPATRVQPGRRAPGRASPLS